MTTDPRTAVHCTILVVDVEAFGDPQRTMQHQLNVRAGLYHALRAAFDAANIPWQRCYHEDRGDGVLVLAPADLPKAPILDALPAALATALRRHNSIHPDPEKIRLRMAVHAGEVTYDPHGVTARSINLTFRLLQASSLKTALTQSGGTLALIVSEWLFDEVVRHTPDADPSTWRQVTVTVKETTTSGWISLPDRPYPPNHEAPVPIPGEKSRPVPDHLPAPPRWFTGRTEELDTLTAALDAAHQFTDRHATVIISAICGAGGTGKTSLALHWAHHHRDQFPDGVLYLNLRGFEPGHAPLPTTAAIHGFLAALGVESAAIPSDLTAQTGLYRSLLSNKRVLILLDNARDANHVVPLLPGRGTSVVLITSRYHLTGLATTYGASIVDLDVLTDHDAYLLLEHRLGHQRLAAEPDAVNDLLSYCAGLPLALSIVAAQATHHPRFPLRTLAAELENQTHRVDAFDTGDSTTTLRAALSCSTHVLTADANTAFVLLGHAPGPDISVPAAATLFNQSITTTKRLLRELEHASLIIQHVPGRYRMHDLVRLYTTTCTGYSSTNRQAAMRRLIDFYVHTACTGELLIRPHQTPIIIEPYSPHAAPQHPLTDHTDALAWFENEHACLLAAQQTAAANEWHPAVWQLAWALNTFHFRQGLVHHDLAMWQAGIVAAEQLADPIARAIAHNRLGLNLIQTGQHHPGQGHLQQALALAESNNDIARQAHAHQALGWACRKQGLLDRAIQHANRALRLFRQLGDPILEANTLNAIGWYAALANMYDVAQVHCQAALTLHLQHHDYDGEAAARDNLGYIAHHTGQYRHAIDLYRQALTLDRYVGHWYEHADVLDRLGQPYLALGHRAQARTTWIQALAAYQAQLRTADAIRVQHQLTLLDAHP